MEFFCQGTLNADLVHRRISFSGILLNQKVRISGRFLGDIFLYNKDVSEKLQASWQKMSKIDATVKDAVPEFKLFFNLFLFLFAKWTYPAG